MITPPLADANMKTCLPAMCFDFNCFSVYLDYLLLCIDENRDGIFIMWQFARGKVYQARYHDKL